MNPSAKPSPSGLGFVFSTLAPIFLLCALANAFFTYATLRDGDFKKALMFAAATIGFLCTFLALYNSARFPWAGRVVTGLIFGAYLAYAIHEWFFTGHTFQWWQSKSAASPRNALLGLLLIGGPCLWYTLTGRLTLKKPAKPVLRRSSTDRPVLEVLGPAPRIRRPFVARERDLLKAATVFQGPGFWRSLGWISLWTCICLGSAWGFVALISALERLPHWMGYFAAIAFLVPICSFYAAYMVASAYREGRRTSRRVAEFHAPRLQAALHGLDASIISVEARSVIEIESTTDEDTDDTTWLFALHDGNTLYLRGYEYYPVDDHMPWPAKRFDIVRAAANDQWIGLFSKGPALQPDQVVSAAEMPDDYRWTEEPASETVLAGSPGEVLYRLGYRPAERSE